MYYLAHNNLALTSYIIFLQVFPDHEDFCCFDENEVHFEETITRAKGMVSLLSEKGFRNVKIKKVPENETRN
jgi:hypothetical protein